MKPKFKLEDYIGKYVMHCNTQENAEVFCNFLDEHDKKWCGGVSYKKVRWWHTYEERTCYAFNKGQYADKDLYLSEGYTVLEFDDFDWGEENENHTETYSCKEPLQTAILNAVQVLTDKMKDNNDNPQMLIACVDAIQKLMETLKSLNINKSN